MHLAMMSLFTVPSSPRDLHPSATSRLHRPIRRGNLEQRHHPSDAAGPAQSYPSPGSGGR